MEANNCTSGAWNRFSLNTALMTLLALATGLALLAGCATCKPGKSAGEALTYDINLAVGDSLKDASFQLDVVGVNPSELPKWQSYSLKNYFGPRDPVREDALKKTFVVPPGSAKVLQVPASDALWAQWKKAGVQYLVVLADPPFAYPEGKIGSQDPRRQLVPLCECYWPKKTKALDLKVQAGGISIVTPLREGWTAPPW